MSILTSLASRLRNLRSVLLVFAAVVVGLVFPAAAPFVRDLTPWIVAFLVYSSLVGVSFSRTGLVRSLRPIAAVLFITYAVIPVVGGLWSGLFLSDGMGLGTMAILAAPATAGSAIVWTRLAGGNVDVSGLATISSLLLAPLCTPVILRHLTGGSTTALHTGIEWQLLFIIVVAVILLAVAPDGVGSPTMLDSVTAISIGLLIYAAVGTTGMERPMYVLSRAGSVVVVVFLTAIAVGFVFTLVTRGTREDLIAIVFSGSLKNLGIALLIVIGTSSPAALSMVIGYYVSQQLLSAVLIDGLSSRWEVVDSALRTYSR
jgi:predicted Na+-dependent transporter